MQNILSVTSPSGECFGLDQPFNRGGEAEIWTIRSEPHLVAKLYHLPTIAHEAKVTAMLANPPQQPSGHPAVAWPLQLLYRRQQFAGYLMPRIHESRPIFHFYNPVRRAQLNASYSWRYFLHRTARNLAAAVELVHQRGYVVGDLNESNVLVNPSALVTLVDVDSFQVKSGSSHIYRSMVGKAEFTPPELQGVDFKSTDRTTAHDNFGLAVLLFYLLMEGYHPFAGVRNDSLSVGRVDLYGIRHGHFPYTRGSEVAPPPKAPNFMWLSPALQRCFRRAFLEGHGAPEERPSAHEWHEVLIAAEDALIPCPVDKHHVYANHLGRCPYCTRETVPLFMAPGLQQPAPESIQQENVASTVAPLPMPAWFHLLLIARYSGWQAVSQIARHKVQFQLQHALQDSFQWTKTQGTSLWQSGQRQSKMVGEALVQLPKQLPILRETAQSYGVVGRRWLIGNALGSPGGALAALGSYQLILQGASLPAFAPLLTPLLVESTTPEQWLSPQLLWMICGLFFGATLGLAQGWALRTQLLRWRYLRELWVVVSGLAGTAVGALAYSHVTVAMLLQPLWSAEHLYLAALVLLFGAILGFLQSFILRQQLARADDSRIWTVTNAFAWLFVFEMSMLGLRWNQTLVGTESLAVDSPVTFISIPANSAAWIGGWLGATVGLLCAGVLTGSTLLWMLRGQRRGLYWHHIALRLMQWRFLPHRLRQGTVRWGRGVLLLLLLVLLLEGLLLLGQ